MLPHLNKDKFAEWQIAKKITPDFNASNSLPLE